MKHLEIIKGLCRHEPEAIEAWDALDDEGRKRVIHAGAMESNRQSGLKLCAKLHTYSENVKQAAQNMQLLSDALKEWYDLLPWYSRVYWWFLQMR